MSDDLISRQMAIDTINELHDKPNAWLDLAVDALEKLPSAQSERKRGEWIATHERTIFSHPDSITYVCSECGYKIYTIYGMPSTTTYCPSCGVRMDGEENG